MMCIYKIKFKYILKNQKNYIFLQAPIVRLFENTQWIISIRSIKCKELEGDNKV